MGILTTTFKNIWNSLFTGKIKEAFDVNKISSASMDKFCNECTRIYMGNPPWISEENDITTINVARTVSSETARLTVLGIKITVDGSERAKWIQEQIDEKIFFSLRNWVEYGVAFGTVILKPNGNTVDLYTKSEFVITDHENGKITGCVFINKKVSKDGKKYYTRLEYHRFAENGDYLISNRCYVGSGENDVTERIDINETPWQGMLEDVAITNCERPLFGVFRTPHANNIDIESPEGLPIFSDAIQELKDIDIAYSRNADEIYDSSRTTLLDSDKLLEGGRKVEKTAPAFEQARKRLKLPRYVRNVFANSSDQDFYQEINPQLNTEMRIKGINNYLSIIGFKCGYSNGYFVLDEKTGMVTATQVESDDRRTIQFIKDVRDRLEDCMNGLLYAMNGFADMYNLAPLGTYEVTYDFGDITYNREEDKIRWWGYVTQNKIPAWYYFVKFEGMSEEEAKALVEEAEPKEPTLFGGEE